MPLRPDIADVDAAEWKAAGNVRPRDHQNAIDLLQPGDVFVVDVFGSVASGGVIGDNLAFYIMTNAAGFVIDGAIRDLEGIAAFDLAGYFRGATPPAIRNVMVTGVNIPVRIGNTTVMPGDVVFGDREGVSFIPPHLLQGMIDSAQITHIHDEWTRMKFAERKYKSTDVYSRPRDPALLKEYEEFLKQKLGPKAYEEYQKRPPAQGPAPARR
jgi:regulator of RNase E activity RraA